MATAATTAVNVTFVFANYEKKVLLATTLASSGADLKTQLLANWPEGIPVCEDRSRIRMICMGNGFLTDDKVLGPKFPVFAHPTPINVSIRPIQTSHKTGTSNVLTGGANSQSNSGTNNSGSISTSNSGIVETGRTNQTGTCPRIRRLPTSRSRTYQSPPTVPVSSSGGACCIIN